jgi:hypothetical protein
LVSTPLTLLLLRLADPAAFAATLREHAVPNATAMLHSSDTVLGDSLHGQALAGRAAYDAVVFVTGEEQLATLRQLAPLLAGCVDMAASAAIAGIAQDITAGTERSRLVFSLRRRADLTRAEFHDYWFNRHAAGPRERGQPSGYHQLHAEEEASAAAAQAVGLAVSDHDGAALFKCAEFESKRRAFRHPATLEALEDERRFIDHQRSELGTYHPL